MREIEELALAWWRSLDKHQQFLAIEKWRALGELGCDWPAHLIAMSESTIGRIWLAEKARESGKTPQGGGEILEQGEENK